MKREQAMEEIQKEDYIGTDLYNEDYDFTIKKLGIRVAQFEEIMALPLKTHYDYPTNRWALEKMPRLFAMFKSIATRP